MSDELRLRVRSVLMEFFPEDDLEVIDDATEAVFAAAEAAGLLVVDREEGYETLRCETHNALADSLGGCHALWHPLFDQDEDGACQIQSAYVVPVDVEEAP